MHNTSDFRSGFGDGGRGNRKSQKRIKVKGVFEEKVKI